jgi:hypothetical protein
MDLWLLRTNSNGDYISAKEHTKSADALRNLFETSQRALAAQADNPGKVL